MIAYLRRVVAAHRDLRVAQAAGLASWADGQHREACMTGAERDAVLALLGGWTR